MMMILMEDVVGAILDITNLVIATAISIGNQIKGPSARTRCSQCCLAVFRWFVGFVAFA